MSQSDTTTPEAGVTESIPTGKKASFRTKRLVLMLGVPGMAALIAAGFYLRGGRYVESDNAYIKADKIAISTEVSAPVRDVLVRENDTVEAGQILFRLDPAPFEMAVTKAQAKLAQVQTDLIALKASHQTKQAEIATAKTKSTFAAKDQQRQADLMAKNFISAAKYDDAALNTQLTQQQIVVLQQDLGRIAATLGGNPQRPLQEHPSYQAALSELERAQLDLRHVEVRAPLAGVVSKLPKPGQYLAAGSTAMALVTNNNLWIEANLTETDLTHVHPGQAVRVLVDTYPDQQWNGKVDSVSPATGAEFSVLPAQNATGNWVKIAQRVPVKIALEAAPQQPLLRAGLSAVIEIDTGHKRRLLGISL